MQFLIPLATIITFGGQAYSQAESVSGQYTIIDSDSDALTAGVTGPFARFTALEGTGSPAQIWGFNPISPEYLFIQSHDNGAYIGQYLNCPVERPGSPCTLSYDPQIFIPHAVEGKQDQYSITDDTGRYALLATSNNDLVLVDTQRSGDTPALTLTRAPVCK